MRQVSLRNSCLFSTNSVGHPIPQIPFDRDTLDELRQTWSPSDICQPDWANHFYPFLGLALVNPSYNSVLLSPLAYRPPIIFNGSRYLIPSESSKNWLVLETLLMRVGYVLLNHSDILLPLYFSYPKLPSSYGINHSYRTEGAARAAISRTLHAFNILIERPSRDVFDYGRIFLGSDGTEYWDDWLTDEEINLICGCYNVKTDTPGQFSAKSRWPRPAMFEKHGKGAVGFWSPSCEKWFRDRRASILAGKAEPLSANQWRQAMKFSKRMKWVAEANRFLSGLFMDGTRF